MIRTTTTEGEIEHLRNERYGDTTYCAIIWTEKMSDVVGLLSAESECKECRRALRKYLRDDWDAHHE